MLLASLVVSLGCGARSGLHGPDADQDGGAGGTNPSGGAPNGGGGESSGGGGEAPMPCGGVEERPCGSDVGECVSGIQRCQADGFFGPCEGEVGPNPELCNGLDDDCDGNIDDGFGLGEACDGPDSDLCFDDVMTCDGCSLGPNKVETCNGTDDNCNGVIDSDCEVGDCAPTLIVTGSTPSSPSCIDFPVEKGSTGTINYPCGGGMVTATLGSVSFSGSVVDGNVSLQGTVQFQGPDGCFWQADHFISGSIPAGTVQYFYQETLLTQPGFNCWSPCTETGVVDIDWLN
ncbi:MAG: MopE-related protein [Polyangiaceae bacterium]